MRNAEKRFISLWTRLYQTLSSTTPTPKQRNRTSKKEASLRPSRWTQTGRKRGTPPNRSCDQARKTPQRPACLPTPNHLPPLVVSPTGKATHTPPILHKTACTPRQSIQANLMLCRGVLYACTPFRAISPNFSFSHDARHAHQLRWRVCITINIFQIIA